MTISALFLFVQTNWQVQFVDVLFRSPARSRRLPLYLCGREDLRARSIEYNCQLRVDGIPDSVIRSTGSLVGILVDCGDGSSYQHDRESGLRRVSPQRQPRLATMSIRWLSNCVVQR